jgi:hypothetical protein
MARPGHLVLEATPPITDWRAYIDKCLARCKSDKRRHILEQAKIVYSTNDVAMMRMLSTFFFKDNIKTVLLKGFTKTEQKRAKQLAGNFFLEGHTQAAARVQ